MSTADDVAVLLRAVGKGATVEVRVGQLVQKVRGLLQGMRMNVTDPDVRGMLDEAAAGLGAHADEIVAAVVGETVVKPVALLPAPEPDEPEPDEPSPEPRRHAAAHKKPAAKRARR